MKKLSLIGRGTAGCLALGHFLKYTDWEIDWIYDPNVPTQSVGEGANLVLPRALSSNLNFMPENLADVDGTFKFGIRKINFKGNQDWYHYFPPCMVSYHFNAVKLQDYTFKILTANPRINTVEKSIISYNDIDSDYIMDCSGKPSSFENFYIPTIPVNSVHVTQCFWDYPKFQYTLTIARPYGWVFGIPLQNRCSIGYLYNHKLNDIEEIKDDVQQVFNDFNLTPSSTTNSFNFANYYRKCNFDSRIVYNGNASFFLEPLEATSIYTMDSISRYAFDFWNNIITEDEANFKYNRLLKSIEQMINMHYYCGSTFDSKFWSQSRQSSLPIIEEMKNSLEFQFAYHASQDPNIDHRQPFPDWATWHPWNLKQNLSNLGFSY